MRHLLPALLLHFVSLGFGCVGAPESSGFDSEQHLRFGEPDTDDAYPAVGGLWRAVGAHAIMFSCTATVIGDQTVLTAAHCVTAGFSDDDASPLRPVDVGALLFEVPQDNRFIEVDGVRIHRHYNQQSTVPYPEGMDVAVLRLAEPAGVEPIRTLVDTAVTPAAAIAVGLGDTESHGIDPETGEVVELDGRHGERRVATLSHVRFEPGIGWTNVAPGIARPEGPVDYPDGWTVYSDDRSGTCFGDSGSPLLVEQAGGLAIAGVASALSVDGGYGPCEARPTEDGDLSVGRSQAWYTPMHAAGREIARQVAAFDNVEGACRYNRLFVRYPDLDAADPRRHFYTRRDGCWHRSSGLVSGRGSATDATFAEASAACEASTEAGLEDWRLASFVEARMLAAIGGRVQLRDFGTGTFWAPRGDGSPAVFDVETRTARNPSSPTERARYLCVRGRSVCPGDANGDRRVDHADLDLVLANWGRHTADGDLDYDGFVAQGDLDEVLLHWGHRCD